MTIETIREIGHPFEGYGRPVITSSETEIVISAIGSYRMSTQAAEATAKAIDNEGNHPMKPVTAFWLAVIPLLIAGNVWAWGRNHEWVSLACVCLLVLTFAFWVNEGRKEFRQRRDMEKLIKGLIEESIALKKMLIIVTNARLGKTDDNR